MLRARQKTSSATSLKTISGAKFGGFSQSACELETTIPAEVMIQEVSKIVRNRQLCVTGIFVNSRKMPAPKRSQCYQSFYR